MDRLLSKFLTPDSQLSPFFREGIGEWRHLSGQSPNHYLLKDSRKS